MSLTITPNDHAYLVAVLRQMDDVPQVDYQKVADEVGTKYAKNARAAVKKLWEKLKQDTTASEGDETANGSDEAGAKTKKASKPATPKTAKVTKPAARRASNAGAKKGKKPTKKDQEAMEKELLKQEDEANEEADLNDQTMGNIGQDDDDLSAENGEEEYVDMTNAEAYQAYRVKTPDGFATEA